MPNPIDTKISELLKIRMDELLDGFRDNVIREEVVSNWGNWLDNVLSYYWRKKENIVMCNKVVHFPAEVDLDRPALRWEPGVQDEAAPQAGLVGFAEQAAAPRNRLR